MHANIWSSWLLFLYKLPSVKRGSKLENTDQRQLYVLLMFFKMFFNYRF